jgi:hypothetical protein
LICSKRLAKLTKCQILNGYKDTHQHSAIEKENTGLDSIWKIKKSFLQLLIHLIIFIIGSHDKVIDPDPFGKLNERQKTTCLPTGRLSFILSSTSTAGE